MAGDILSSSGIESLVETYYSSEISKTVEPLKKQKSKYQNISTAYTTLTSKLTSFKTLLSSLSYTGTSSIFKAKAASSSNSNFVTATTSNSAAASNYSLRVNQLAKSDLAISQSLTASTANLISGTHSFVIKTGDGSTGEFTSNVEVTFDESETNQTVMEKIRDAINTDKAVVLSSSKTAADTYTGGASSFIINLNGTETTISVNGGGTYSDLMTEIAASITSNVPGVLAEKIEEGGNVSIRLTVKDTSKYISISHSSGFDLVTDLAISATKEKGGAGSVTASAFAPSTGNFQFSIAAKDSGLDYRIKSLSDSVGSSALNFMGLNFGTTRTTFDQDSNIAGFVYSDITSDGNQLNAKLNFNGIDIQRNANTISDLASGVTFNLKSVMQVTDSSVNVTTSNDVKSIKSNIETFISKFNDLFSFLKTNTSWNSGSRGILISDGSASNLMNLLRTTAYGQISGVSSDALSMLTQIGLNFDSSSGLSISDSTLLEDQITNNIEEFESLFNSDNGIATTLYDAITPYLGTAGYINTQKNTIDSSITRVNSKIKSSENRIEKSAQSLREKYQQMQSQLAQMYSMQSYFSSGGFFS